MAIREELGERNQWEMIHVDIPTWGMAAESENLSGHTYLEELLILGQEGWELVTVVPLKYDKNRLEAYEMRYFFKRQSYYQEILYE